MNNSIWHKLYRKCPFLDPHKHSMGCSGSGRGCTYGECAFAYWFRKIERFNEKETDRMLKSLHGIRQVEKVNQTIIDKKGN